ncbi:MAG TPA: wax ester/triacylglycerol synthase domain-containing protein, partial [Frankiaceae bacterium]|nr:wax ester/triacylglycerol synthase domain-containing protein [Frankiaceae bacterium]
MVGGAGPVIERASPDDLMQLACDVGPVPMQVGAVLVLAAGPAFDVSAAEDVIAERITAIPRLRQVLVRVPIGCGRPIWVDDATFDIRRHVRCVTCQPPGDEAALLGTAVAIAAEPLPSSRPLWSATFVTGLIGSRVALVVVFHHVLADGIGGLAVLANLVDGVPVAAPAPFPRPAPARRQLAVDALGARCEALARLSAALRALRPAVAELSPAGTARVPRTTLNRPTGPCRRITVTRADLGRIRDVAHAHGGTVNDAVLTAVTGALRALLARRGEPVDDLVVSVPVSGRTSSTAARLGNRVGVMPVSLPAGGDRLARLERIAAITRAHKTARRGASAALLGPVFRALAALGVLRWSVNRQRLVHTFATNLRGPDQRHR